ncbi:MAG: hypothetical protein DRN90_07975, partial [Thermoproteota archaeon]
HPDSELLKGPMVNEKLDEIEEEIWKLRWGDREILVRDGRTETLNLEYRFLNGAWFGVDGETLKKARDPKGRPWYDTSFNLEVALKNAKRVREIRRENLEHFNRRDIIEKLVKLCGNDPGFEEKWKKPLSEIAGGWDKVRNIHWYAICSARLASDVPLAYKMLLEQLKHGNYYDILQHAIIWRAYQKNGHESYIGPSKLLGSMFGLNIYGGDGNLPNGKLDGFVYTTPSKSALEAMMRIGEVLIDPETGATPADRYVAKSLLRKLRVWEVTIFNSNGKKRIYPSGYTP